MAQQEKKPANWQQRLGEGQPQETVAMLQAVEYFRPPGAVAVIESLLTSADFAVRLRALIAVGRLEEESAAPLLLRFMEEERDTHWRLAALDSFCQLPGEKATALAAFYPRRRTYSSCGG